MRPQLKIAAILASVALCLPISASAQQSWDTAAFEEQLLRADQLFEEAQALPQWERDQRRTILLDAAQIRRDAMEMARQALIGDRLTVEEEPAVMAAFLQVNLSALEVFIALDQCAAAELLLRQGLADPSILPDGGSDDLRELQPEIEACNARISAEPPPWDRTAFEDLVAEAGATDAEVSDLPEDEADLRRSLLYESLLLKEDALSILRRAMDQNHVESAEQADSSVKLRDLYVDTVRTFIALELCDGAARQLENAGSHLEYFPAGGQGLLNALESEVTACRDAAASARREAAEPEIVDEPVSPEEPSVDYTPYILFGVAAATATTAVLIGSTLGGERNARDELDALCAQGPCNREMLTSLNDTIDTGSIWTWTFAGVALASASVGVVLLLIEDDEPTVRPQPNVSLAPMLGPATFGGSLGIRF